MILHRDGLVEMQYDAAVDILKVKWLDSKGATRDEFGYSFQKLLETIRNYDIKKLLIDSREDITAVTDEEYKELNTTFANKLAGTRLARIARLGTTNTSRESFVEALVEDVLALPDTTVAYHNFYDEQHATAWLVA
ncbi:hypothetical protein [Pontibacter chitinilyticus]|uniref:hypothetical protein n=1 Tax=Pontibacter chitinilyticus TaxID=2674989 RepID=UPI00321977AC